MAIIGTRKARAVHQAKRATKKPPIKKHKCYLKRNDNLSELGYGSYDEYLKSDDWKKIRDTKLQRYPYCLLCGGRPSQVHHLSYDNETLLGMAPHRLVTLCSQCHRDLEFDGDRKRNLREANAALFEKAKQSCRGNNWIRYFELVTKEQKGRARAARRSKKERWIQRKLQKKLAKAAKLAERTTP